MLPLFETQTKKSQIVNSYPTFSNNTEKPDEEMKTLVKSVGVSGGKFTWTNLNNKDLFQYFANHISDFINLALNDTETICGKKAFIILSNGPPIITNALIQDFTFFLKVTEFLQSPVEVSTCTINRIATIFQNLIFNNEQCSIDSIGFLTQLLPYAGEDAVFELFHSIFTCKNQLKQMRFILSTINIDTFILNEIEKSSIDMLKDSSFLSFSKIFNLLKLISDALKNKQLKKSFQNSDVLKMLANLAKEVKAPLLLNNIWDSLAQIADGDLVSKMKDVFNEAMKIISHPFDTLHSYHIFIFDFLTIVVDTSATMFSSSQKRQICQIIQNLTLKFPNSTNLITSMTNFIRKSFHTREFAQRILDNYVSFFVDIGKSATRTASSANALVFLSELDDMKSSSYMVSKSLSSNRKYMNFYQSFFKNYLEELKKPYGGNVQRFSIAKK